MPTRYAAGPEEVAQLLSDWGEPKYRLLQVWDGLYRRRAPLEELTDLSLPLRNKLSDALPLLRKSTEVTIVEIVEDETNRANDHEDQSDRLHIEIARGDSDCEAQDRSHGDQKK